MEKSRDLTYQEPITRSVRLPCHGIFTDRSIFRLNLMRIQTPTGASLTKHKHALSFQLTSSFNQKIKKKNHHFFSSPLRVHVDQNSSISREKKSKNRPVCKNALTPIGLVCELHSPSDGLLDIFNVHFPRIRKQV